MLFLPKSYNRISHLDIFCINNKTGYKLNEQVFCSEVFFIEFRLHFSQFCLGGTYRRLTNLTRVLSNVNKGYEYERKPFDLRMQTDRFSNSAES